MIKKISITNFKSIKNLQIDCKRINLFIGEPNTGKSNILEALGVLSWCGQGNVQLKSFVRCQGTQNLFYDDLIDQPVKIEVEGKPSDLFLNVTISFENDRFNTDIHNKIDGSKLNLKHLNYNAEISGKQETYAGLQFVKFYRFKNQQNFSGVGSPSLTPPFGDNLFSVVMGNKKLRETMSQFFKDFGFDLVFKPQEKTLEIQKRSEDVIISYPYILISDTLQRIIFYIIAMESNQGATLVFEEPESHAFPYYTKQLGEKITFDETNQYFIASHNPYLLLSILEKANKGSVNVFITYFEGYQTKVKCLNDEELLELRCYDPFFNLNSFIEKET